MPIDLAQLILSDSDTESSPRLGSGRFHAVLRLHHGESVPEYVHVRSKIAEELLTIDFSAEDLDRITNDPRVISVALAKPLQAFSEG